MEKSIAEREINVIDMFWAVCLKWRQILLWAVVFAILAGGMSYLKNARAAAAPKEEKLLEDFELNKEEKKNADAYLEYKQMYGEQVAYNSNAALMRLNADGFYRGTVSYFVNNHYEVEYPLINKANNIGSLVEAYMTLFGAEEFYAGLQEIMDDGETEISYLEELIECENNNGSVLTIYVCGADEQSCRALMELVKETVQAGKADISKNIEDHDITMIRDVCDYISDAELLRYQQDNLSKLSTYKLNLENMKTKMTDTELSYVNAYDKNREQEEQAEETGEAETEKTAVRISKKLIAFGFVGGGALAFAIFAMFYLLSAKLRLEDNFEKTYGVKLLGNVVLQKETKKKWFGFIDRFLDRMRHLNKHYFSEDESISMIAASIKIGAKKQNAAKVYVTGAAMGKEETSLIEKIKRELEKTNVELISGKPILYDAEALEQSAEAGYVVLVEHAGVSLYTEVGQEIEVCEHQGMHVLGAVVVG